MTTLNRVNKSQRGAKNKSQFLIHDGNLVTPDNEESESVNRDTPLLTQPLALINGDDDAGADSEVLVDEPPSLLTLPQENPAPHADDPAPLEAMKLKIHSVYGDFPKMMVTIWMEAL